MHSMMESNFAWYLEFLLSIGEIHEWQYEPRPSFEFPTKANNTYLPDFKVRDKDNQDILYEVKGYLDSRSRVKINRMNKYYPEIKLIVITKDEMKAIKNNFKSLITNWDKALINKEDLWNIQNGIIIL